MAAGAAVLADIIAADWSLMLDATAGGGPGAGIGEVVQGVGDVEQCVRIILTTPKGADPLRPTFGADLWKYLDAPISLARAAIVREVTEAIILWEPRIELLKVSTAPVFDDSTQTGAHLSVTVVWRIKLSKDAPAQLLGTSTSTRVILVPVLG